MITRPRSVVRLKRPITIDGRQVRELKLRTRLRGRAVRRFKRETGEAAKSVMAMVMMTYLTHDQVAALDMEDFIVAADAIAERVEALVQKKGSTNG